MLAKMVVENKITSEKGFNQNKEISGYGTVRNFLLLTLICCIMIQNNNDLKKSLNNLSITSLNCNSLNMSKMGTEKQKVKLYGIVSTRSDIILLSDIRLGNSQGGTCAHELEKLFSVTPYGNYKFLHNSKNSSRGVGILINHKINFSVLETKEDDTGNILLVSADLNGNKITIGAIYGPNRVEEFFFTELGSLLTEIGDQPVILGGD